MAGGAIVEGGEGWTQRKAGGVTARVRGTCGTPNALRPCDGPMTAAGASDALASATPKLPRGNVGRWAKTRRDQATGDMS